MATDVKIMLLGAFQLVSGDTVIVMPGESQRLLAFLALENRIVTRSTTAGTLWPDASEAHAHASLRTALARLDRLSRQAVHVTTKDLEIAPGTRVDIREARALANRLLLAEVRPAADDMTSTAVDALSRDLLPDVYDDWALLEAEDWRQLRLHALEALAQHLADDHRFAEAIRAAIAAVRGEPLRETANATLIHIYLAEGNVSEAVAAFESFRSVLQGELGLDPSPLLRALIDDIQQPTG